MTRRWCLPPDVFPWVKSGQLFFFSKQIFLCIHDEILGIVEKVPSLSDRGVFFLAGKRVSA